MSEDFINENTDAPQPKRDRWEELYEKYAESVKNPTNLYLAGADE